MKKVLIVAASAMAATASLADPPPTVWLNTLGSQHCSDILAHGGGVTPLTPLFLAWADGYASGLGLNPDRMAEAATIIAYCDLNPNSTLQDVVAALVFRLGAARYSETMPEAPTRDPTPEERASLPNPPAGCLWLEADAGPGPLADPKSAAVLDCWTLRQAGPRPIH